MFSHKHFDGIGVTEGSNNLGNALGRSSLYSLNEMTPLVSLVHWALTIMRALQICQISPIKQLFTEVKLDKLVGQVVVCLAGLVIGPPNSVLLWSSFSQPLENLVPISPPHVLLYPVVAQS